MNSWWKGRSAQYGLAVALIVGAIAGMTMGWMLWSPRPLAQEIAAPGVVQPDGSHVLPKQPDAGAKPANQVPKGTVVERIVYVEIQPKPVPKPPEPVAPLPGTGEPALWTPPKIRLDLTLVRAADGTRRVVASSPDGEVVGGLDVPVEAAPPPPRVLKSALGLEYSATVWGNTKSLVGHHDFGWLRVGARVGKATLTMPNGGTLSGAEVGVSALVRF